MDKKPKQKSVKGDFLFSVLFLLVYGLILLSSDPEWLVWAGSMTMGVLYNGELPAVAMPIAPLESLRAASTFGLFGLLALVFLVETAEEKRVRALKSSGTPRP
jgi:hypothetical protein